MKIDVVITGLDYIYFATHFAVPGLRRMERPHRSPPPATNYAFA
jgi:hypothetical protein